MTLRSAFSRFAALSVFAFATLLPLRAEPISVKQLQGNQRGFLLLRDESGRVLGHGEILQTCHGSRVTSRLTYQFRDGSLDEETVVYTQDRTFQLVSDRHIQRGPYFPKPIDFLVEANGQITSRSVDKNGKEKVEVEHMDLPADVSNGMIGALLMNVPVKGPEFQLSMVAPSGKGRLVKLNVSPDPVAKFTDVGTTYTANVFRIKVELGGVAGVVAPIVGKKPADDLVWVLNGEVPALICLMGQLYVGGPMINVELSGTSFPHSGSRTAKQQHETKA